MTNEEFTETMNQVSMLSTMVRVMPLKDFAVAIDRAEAVGPIVDPTLYKESLADGGLERLKKLAHAARDFQRVVEEVAAETT